MGKSLFAFLLLCACTRSFSWHAGGSSPSSSSASSSSSSSPAASSPSSSHADHQAAWARFTLRELRINTETDKVAGFTCDANVGKYRHTCVKFLDDRCTNRPTKIGPVSFSSDLPAGQSCFMDSSTGATYLDRKIVQPPLSSLSVVGTDTRVPRTYEIHFTFAKDVLGDDSKLGKALIAKYGPPDYKNYPIQMVWNAGDAHLRASCGTTEGPHGEYCALAVDDTSVLDVEREKQKQADDEQRRRDAPPPPPI